MSDEPCGTWTHNVDLLGGLDRGEFDQGALALQALRALQRGDSGRLDAIHLNDGDGQVLLGTLRLLSYAWATDCRNAGKDPDEWLDECIMRLTYAAPPEGGGSDG